MRLPLLVIVLCLVSGETRAQQIRELGTSRGGLIRDASTLLAAGDAAADAGVDCDIVAADQRGRGEAGERLYEVACRDAPGWIIITGSNPRAYGCLALADQPRAGSAGCRLRANRNPRRHYARMAAEAGLACRVNDGAFIGRAGYGVYPPTGEPEIGFALFEQHHGRGYATEAATALRDWIFRETDASHFIGMADIRNIASLTVLGKIGMVRTHVETEPGGPGIQFHIYERPKAHD